MRFVPCFDCKGVGVLSAQLGCKTCTMTGRAKIAFKRYCTLTGVRMKDLSVHDAEDTQTFDTILKAYTAARYGIESDKGARVFIVLQHCADRATLGTVLSLAGANVSSKVWRLLLAEERRHLADFEEDEDG